MARRALVVGAGIGGLAAGLSLRQTGWQVQIFERAESPRELGFGLLVAPNAIAALRELGLADVVIERGFTPTLGEVRRMDGTVLKRAELPPPAALGGPTVVALRGALHGALLKAYGNESLTLQTAITAFTTTGGRAQVYADGAMVGEGDVLIGADGIGSVIRRGLHPHETPPRSSGIVAVRGAVHGLVAHLGGLSGIYYLGPGLEAFLVRASDTGIYWALSLSRDVLPEGLEEPAGVLAHVTPKMDRTFRDVSMATHDLRFDELVDREPVPFWGRGCVTLLGDAAHPVLPHTGQGAAQALVDAVALGRALRDGADIAAALRAYERERQPKTAALVAQGRRTARVMRMTSPTACMIREVLVRAAPIKTLFKLVARINRRAGTDVS